MTTMRSRRKGALIMMWRVKKQKHHEQSSAAQRFDRANRIRRCNRKTRRTVFAFSTFFKPSNNRANDCVFRESL
jgi:hypothetical protein